MNLIVSYIQSYYGMIPKFFEWYAPHFWYVYGASVLCSCLLFGILAAIDREFVDDLYEATAASLLGGVLFTLFLPTLGSLIYFIFPIALSFSLIFWVPYGITRGIIKLTGYENETKSQT